MINTHLFKHWTQQIFSPGTVLREKYEDFKALLRHDKRAHELMAELEEIYHEQVRVDFKFIEEKYNALAKCVFEIAENLNRMCPSRYIALKDYARKLDAYARFIFAPPAFNTSPPFVIPLDGAAAREEALVGGKAMNLSIIAGDLRLPVPRGFVITTRAFYALMEYNDLVPFVDTRLAGLDIRDSEKLAGISEKLTRSITGAQVPPDVAEAVLGAYRSVGEAGATPKTCTLIL